MKMLNVRVTTPIRAIPRLSKLTIPNLFIEDEIRDTLILLQFFKYDGAINPVIRVVSQVHSKTRVVV
jgi:hypothetical protein